MERVRQVAGGIVLGVMTVAVVCGAVYALWLGAPLLNPGGDRFGAADIPLINTDAKIVRPIPPADVSPRAGVVQPAPSTSKPKATAVSHHQRATHSHKRTWTVARASSSGSHASAKAVVVASSHESDEGHSDSAETESD